ncbi:MAG: 6-bladed beta-propeller [Candidatus Aminicenantes bacterium]|nr:6-bladed beta-propeller [Candidatus Aminicenantes bacterium]
MAGNYFTIRITFYGWIILLCWFLFLLPTANCKPGKTKQNEIILKDSKRVNTKWEEVFEDSEVVPFKLDKPDSEIISIGDMVINSNGEYFISDGKSGKIMRFTAAGKLLQYIGRKGEGPGEYLLPTCFELDKNDNLYYFDLAKRHINVYSSPGYEFETQVRIEGYMQDMIIADNRDFITYRMTAPENKLIYKYSSTGKLIKSYFSPQQDKLRKFVSRFGLGKISRIPGENFIFVFPEEYKIYFFDYNLNLHKILSAAVPAKFYPFAEKFPNSLTPFDFTKKHAKWWGKSLHAASVFYIGERIFLVLLYKYENLSVTSYINIHDLDGITYAEGVEVPFNGIIRYAGRGYVYVVEETRFDEAGNILPLRLHRYKIKDIKN